MAQMYIVMKPDKSLVITKSIRLHQKESLMDQVTFLVPDVYGEHDLSEFQVIMTYVDTDSVVHAEQLVLDDELYPENEHYLQYHVPVTSQLSRFAGDIKIRLTMVNVNLAENAKYVLETDEVAIEILPIKDYYNFVPDKSLSFVSNVFAGVNTKIQQLDAIAQTYDENKADNIKLDTESEELYLTSHDNPIGDKIKLGDLSDSMVDAAPEGLIEVII